MKLECIARVALKILLVSSIGLFQSKAGAQCDVIAQASFASIKCGDSVMLSAIGFSQGSTIANDFNNSTPGSGWLSSNSAIFTNPCFPLGVDNTPHLWMGNTGGAPRFLNSPILNFSNEVNVCFDLVYATQGANSPCEGPDLPDEGVFFQYTLDGGTEWHTIHYFDPKGGYDPVLTS